MKKILLAIMTIVCFALAQAQVGIGTVTPVATLHVNGTPANTSVADGIIPPKLTGNELKAKDAVYSSNEIGAIVYVTAAVGTASAKTINVTSSGYFYFDGSVWQKLAIGSSTSFGDIKTAMQGADHDGWIKLDGRAKSTLTPTQQARATAIGIATNLPNANNSVLMQNGAPVGSITGSNTRTIAQNQLPNVNLSISGSTSADGQHTHNVRVWDYFASPGGSNYRGIVSGVYNGFTVHQVGSDSNNGVQAAGNHSHTISSGNTSSINGNVTQQTLNIVPQVMSINVFVYLGQ